MTAATTTPQSIIIPAGFAATVKPAVAASGALTNIASGDKNIPDISYNDLDRVPKIVGPLLDLDVGKKGPPITQKEILGDDIYVGLEGSGFDRQRAFLQTLAGRRLPSYGELDSYKFGIHESAEKIALYYATINFLESLLLETARASVKMVAGFLKQEAYSDENFKAMKFLPRELGNHAYKSFGHASDYFETVGLYGAVAILQDFRTRDSEDKNPDNSRYFLKALESGKDGMSLGAAYLYGLYSAKNSTYLNGYFSATNAEEAEMWGIMQRLFMHAGKVHEKEGAYDNATRAYLAGVWAFAKQESVQMELIELAIEALNAIDRTMAHESTEGQFDEIESGTMSTLVQQLIDLRK